ARPRGSSVCGGAPASVARPDPAPACGVFPPRDDPLRRLALVLSSGSAGSVPKVERRDDDVLCPTAPDALLREDVSSSAASPAVPGPPEAGSGAPADAQVPAEARAAAGCGDSASPGGRSS